MFIRKNIIYLSIFIFTIIFSTVMYSKPDFAFNTDGTVKQFGVGFKSKTVIPLFLIVIFIAIFSYLGLMYYILNPKIN